METGQEVREFQLSELAVGTTLHFEGDSGEFDFQILNAGTMPLGILQELEDYKVSLAQCLGMVPFCHHWSKKMPEFEPGVLKTEYGRLLFLRVEDDGMSADTQQFCVGRYEVRE